MRFYAGFNPTKNHENGDSQVSCSYFTVRRSILKLRLFLHHSASDNILAPGYGRTLTIRACTDVRHLDDNFSREFLTKELVDLNFGEPPRAYRK
jgi:hypothetical protein